MYSNNIEIFINEEPNMRGLVALTRVVTKRKSMISGRVLGVLVLSQRYKFHLAYITMLVERASDICIEIAMRFVDNMKATNH